MTNARVTAPTDGGLRRHIWVALLLSVTVFGLGQLYTGRVWWLAGLIAALVVLIALFQTDVPSTFVGFAILLCGLIAIPVVALVHAGAAAWRTPVIARQPFHRWYVYLAYGVAFLLALPADEVEFRSLFGAYHPFRAANTSMEPTIQPGDYFLVKKVVGDEQVELAQRVGAIVAHGWVGQEGTYVHRLIATAGQSVSMRGTDVVIDGAPLSRTVLCVTAPASGSDYNIVQSTEANGGWAYSVQHLDAEWQRDQEEVVVPESSLFLLGDSRDMANDGRYNGAVHRDQLVGVVLFIFWSNDWRRIGKSVTVDAAAPAREDVCGARAAR